ncbi:uncharacterized protein PITG_12855 [Phytophthora infestans T30-4]|uniref:Uncharacterized protein n=1 Tax=Phytophthora infestans (strain T30-4) TaxID=403677 RepID=D0NLB5_PHYIT|nr:uncharacterized protein PITG_12855 [Phytophthora infestans T30-4]EEY60433.1 conserved hypothetical protein [Phytophthora infestans T30-4]|eukprot:XP_002900229.1 conserved hypothetical protein [Phytophthora infestans T30-4]
MGNKLASSGEQRPSHHKHKRRSRSQSEGVTSDCGTAVSTTDSQLPRELSKSSSKVSEKVADQARRIHEAEKILLEIAKEYAAKRAAGLVPTKPVPARTLLWEEMERRSQRVRAGVGRRGSCLFGRDSEEGPCGCASYKKMKKLPDGRENTGGVCECCKHGAPWHRLAGGTMTATGSGVMGMRSSMRSRRTSSRNSRSGSAPQQAPIESSLPYGMMDDPTPPLVHTPARSEGDALDRSSLFSNGDSFGLPPRLSSTSRHLDKLLGAIAKYRAMGLSKDEIEIKIREDFPPTERLSYSANTPRRTRSSG